MDSIFTGYTSKKMKIGDKVRLLKGTEQGVITRIDKNIVEVEIEDGFTIPVLKNEIVLVDRREAETFKVREEGQDESPSTVRLTTLGEGLYLGVNNVQEKLHFFMVNHTSDTVLYSISREEKKNVLGWAAGICESFGNSALGSLPFQDENQVFRLQIQLLTHEEKTKVPKAPLLTSIAISKSQLPDAQFVKGLNETMPLIPLEGESITPIDTNKVVQGMFSAHSATEVPKKDGHSNRQLTIDLHLDADEAQIPTDQLLPQQLKMFDDAFNKALQSNASELKVIHGIGKGKLRYDIHKLLANSKAVRYFEDGDKNRFGNGSTIIYF
jgi:preprotein translocase subunit YajC